MNAVDSSRLKVWQALSQFFLDAEVDQATFNHVAKEIQESGYTQTEVHSILWLEVFPVLQGNLKSVAGEWAGSVLFQAREGCYLYGGQWLMERATESLPIRYQPRSAFLRRERSQESWRSGKR